MFNALHMHSLLSTLTCFYIYFMLWVQKTKTVVGVEGARDEESKFSSFIFNFFLSIINHHRFFLFSFSFIILGDFRKLKVIRADNAENIEKNGGFLTPTKIEHHNFTAMEKLV